MKSVPNNRRNRTSLTRRRFAGAFGCSQGHGRRPLQVRRGRFDGVTGANAAASTPCGGKSKLGRS